MAFFYIDSRFFGHDYHIFTHGKYLKLLNLDILERQFVHARHRHRRDCVFDTEYKFDLNGV